MKVGLQNHISKATIMWQGLLKSPKIKSIAVTAVLFTALTATILLTSKPTMVVVLQNVDLSTVELAQEALQEKAGISSDARSTVDGQSLWVNENDANSAKILLAQQNIPNASGFTYADALNNNSLGTFDKIIK